METLWWRQGVRLMTSRPIRILEGREQAASGDALVFQAEDQDGPLAIWVPILTWERLRAEAPDWSDGGDRRDYALGMIEAEAAKVGPSVTSGGFRVLMVAD